MRVHVTFETCRRALPLRTRVLTPRAAQPPSAVQTRVLRELPYSHLLLTAPDSDPHPGTVRYPALSSFMAAQSAKMLNPPFDLDAAGYFPPSAPHSASLVLSLINPRQVTSSSWSPPGKMDALAGMALS